MAVILPSVYKDGTATVANGGIAVTGVGTLWAQAVLPGDFFGVHKGSAIRIASVESNTALTLSNPWPGTAQTTAAYEIMLQSDMARVQESTRQLLILLMGGNINAFAGLTGAADKAPYFTGSGTMALTDLKTKGRDIAASETLTALLAKLGPAHGGVMRAPSLSDVAMVDGDFNTLTYPGVYEISGSWANGPTSAAATTYTGMVIVYKRSDNAGYWQVWRSASTGRTSKRFTSTTNAASWPNAWISIEHQMAGTVSQSGGVPTGAIIEKGNSANGEYVKFGDGTLICMMGLDMSGQAIATARGALFGSAQFTWTYPAAFAIFTPKITYDFERNDGGILGGGSSLLKSLTTLNFHVWNSSSNPAGNNKLVGLSAVGRWY